MSTTPASVFGHIRTLPSGKYQARFRDRTGYHNAPTTFAKRADAQRWLNDQESALRRGEYVDHRDGRVLFGPYAAEVVAGMPGRPSSRIRDAGYLARYLVPTFGHLKLAEVTPERVRAWVRKLGESGGNDGKPLAPATVLRAGQLLGQVFDQAVADRRLAVSPTTGVKWPKAERHELDVLTGAEVVKLAEAIDPRYRAVVLLGCRAGLRFGEITGLKVADLTLAGPSPAVRVRRAVTEVSGHLYEGPPKSRAGLRSVPLDPATAAELAELVDGLAPGDLVAPAPGGGYMRLASWRRRFWQPATKAIGRPSLRVHDMRHTAVSSWVAGGIDPLRVKAWGGHSSVVVILDRYGHLMPNADGAAAMARVRAVADAEAEAEVVSIRARR